MFQFRRFPTYTYFIQCTLSEYCSDGFPHSEICGSMFVCQLPAAYRKLLRPSSPVIAKASTLCTLSLVSITLTSLSRIRYTVFEFTLPYPKQSNFLRSLHILLITITTQSNNLRLHLQIIGFTSYFFPDC